MALHEIYTAQQLKDFRDLVNAGSTEENAILMNDIDLAGNDSDQWIPIGINPDSPYVSTANAFEGTFDGNGYTISGIYIDKSAISTIVKYQGFFGVTRSGYIKNLTIEGTILLGSNASYCGGIVGYSSGYGYVLSCKNKINISSSNGMGLGGIIGYNQNCNTIKCINEGNISGNTSIGGIVGQDRYADYIQNNTNTGAISGTSSIGGIAGFCYRSVCIQNNTNTGAISGTSSIGGITGYCDYVLKYKFKRNVNSGLISGTSLIGAIIGNVKNTSLTFSELIFSETNDEGFIILDNYYSESSCSYGIGNPATTEESLRIIKTVGADTPILPIIPTYEITTVQELKDFRDLTNLGYTYINAKLMNDIDLAGNDSDQWIPIASQASRQWPEYTGTFDGNGYKISGLYINRSTVLDEYEEPDYDIDDCAFIGQLADEGIVKNLILEGYILGGWWSVAGFVGELWGGKIINCINKVIITGPEDGDTLGGIAGCCGWGNTIPRNSEIANCTNDANVGIEIGSGAFGGIIGFGSDCNITNCINKGNIFGGSYAIAGISGDNNRSVIDNCVNMGNITGTFGTYDDEVAGIASYCDDESIISNCVNTGIITGLDYVGGIVSWANSSQIKNCVNEGTIVCEGTYYGSICGELDIPIITTYGDDFSVSFTLNDGNIDMGTVYPNYKHYYEDVTPTGTVYEIYTAQQLKDFRDLVNAGNYTISAKLMNDIDLAGSESDQWVPIADDDIIGNDPYVETIKGAEFNGTFDGNSYSINGIYINSTNKDCRAFISRAGETAVIKNLKLNGNISSTSNNNIFAGFVALGFNCKIINCINNIHISGTGYIGNGGFISLIRSNSSEKYTLISNCINNGYITTTASWVGGIIGHIYDSNAIVNVYNCVNNADVDSSSGEGISGIIGSATVNTNIYNCVNNGSISSPSTWHNSISGISDHGNMYNCLNNGAITGTKYVAGITINGIAKNCINRGPITCSQEDYCGYGAIYGSVTNLDSLTNYNNYYLNTSCDRGYTDNATSVGVVDVLNIITTFISNNTPACSSLLLLDYTGTINNVIYPEYYTTSVTEVILTNVSSNGDYPDNNFYLNTSCDRAGINRNAENPIMTTIENAFATYTEGNAPNVTSLIEDFKINKKIIIPKIYPDINTDITDITFSNWSISGTINANIENDTVLLQPTVPKKEIIIDKL